MTNAMMAIEKNPGLIISVTAYAARLAQNQRMGLGNFTIAIGVPRLVNVLIFNFFRPC